MKTKSLFSAALLLFVVISSFSVSCKSDDDSESGGGGAAEGTITAKVNGSSFTSMEMTTTAHYESAGGFGMLSIMGTSSNLKTINLNLSHLTSQSPGTYEIGGENLVLVNATYIESTTSGSSQNWMAPYDDGVHGSITISEWTDSNIKGTFHYDAALIEGSTVNTSNIKTVTEGSFNVNL